EELAIKHVRDRRERMPIVGMHVRECPQNVLPRQSCLNLRVLAHVNPVVVIDEAMAKRLPKNRERDRHQGNADCEFQNELGAHNFVSLRRAAHANKLSILHVSGAKSNGVFTGLIEEVGRVLWIRMTDRGTQLQLTAPKLAAAVAVGDSVSVNGCCLTVSARREEQLTFDLLEETLDRTNLKKLRRDSPVNLERAVAAGAPVGGHFVQGHIDCSAKIVSFERTGEDYRLEVELPADFAHYAAYKGSVAI